MDLNWAEAILFIVLAICATILVGMVIDRVNKYDRG